MTDNYDASNMRPLSEVYLEVAEDWADKEAAAQLLEDTKSAVLSQRMLALGDMAVNKAETIIKASPDWHEHIKKVVEARHQANLAKVKKEYIDKKYGEWQSQQANERVGARM